MQWLVRRRCLLFAVLAAAIHGRSGAQPAWPWKAVRIIVAYPPGGVSDLVARELAELLAARLGVPVLVENRAGASGTLAMERVAGSPADGHVLGFAAATAVALMTASGRRDPGLLPVTPVAGVMRTPVLVAGTPALRARTFAEMLSLARVRSSAVRWATTGAGTTGHNVLERVRRASGAHLVHIPYKGGGQQITDALGGHFEVLSTNVAPQQLEAIRRGRLTALAVGAPARPPACPRFPTCRPWRSWVSRRRTSIHSSVCLRPLARPLPWCSSSIAKWMLSCATPACAAPCWLPATRPLRAPRQIS